MAISRINFTAEPNLLTKMQNHTITQPAPAEVKEQPAAEEPKKSNKVRNWSIGMGSAAVLIGLGVLGHNGKLGKGIQKLLGGAEKNSDDIADRLETKIDDWADEIFAELEGKANSTTDDIAEAAERTAAGQAAKKGFPEIAKTAEEVTPEYIARVNASLDRTIPNLDDVPLKIEIPELNPVLKKELESIDASKLGEYGGRITLPNGNTRSIHIIDGKVSAVFEYTPENKQVLYAQYNIDGLLARVEQGNIEHRLRNGQVTQFTQLSGSQKLAYKENGQLHYIEELNAGGDITRTIYVDYRTKNISEIFYKTPTQKNIKIDHFIDGKLAVEEFTDESYKTLKEIRHDLSK